MSRVVIVGAGISGLALAFRLRQRHPAAEITLLESSSRPGGKIWTEHTAGYQVELGPNGFLDNKPSTIDLCKDLGIGNQLIAASEAAAMNRFLFLGDRLHALPRSLIGFLRSDLLSWQGKLSVLVERYRKRRTEAGDEAIDAFARRRLGTEAADTLADAFVAGIHAGDPKLLSMPAAFPRITAMERDHGSVFKAMSVLSKQRRREARSSGKPSTGQMWSFQPGLRFLVESLASMLAGSIHAGVRVMRIQRVKDDDETPAWQVRAEGGDRWTADVLVLTCPAYEQAFLLSEIDTELADKIGSIAYNCVTVVALGYRREDIPGSVDGFGYLTPQRLGRDILGAQWCSSIFPERAPSGHVLIRAMAGGWNRSDIGSWNDEHLLEAVQRELQMSMGIKSAPVFHQVVRWPNAIPQYHLGHLERVAWIEQRLQRHSGLFLGGNAYRGLAINDCTENAGLLAERIVPFLG